MGGHMRLAHGIKVKKVVSDTPNTPNTRGGDLNEVSDVSGIEVREVSDVREIRPSDYMRKKESVIEQKILPQFPVLVPFTDGYSSQVQLPYLTIPITLAEWESGQVEPAIRNWIEKQAKKHDMTGDEYMKYFDDYLMKHPDVAKSYEIYKPQFVYFGM
jgi:hypothetical protein